jgi:hypothetical protein
VTSHMTGHVLEAREVTRSAFVSSGELGFVTGLGSAQRLTEPEPPQAGPEPRLLGRAGPAHH